MPSPAAMSSSSCAIGKAEELGGWGPGRLAAWLLASALLHLLLLEGLPSWPPPLGPPPRPAPGRLAVELIWPRQAPVAPADAPAPAPRAAPDSGPPARPAQRQPQPERAPPAPSPRARPSTGPPEEPPPATSPSSPRGPAETRPGGDPGPPLALIRGLLEERLADRFRYPLLARRRGWEGRVLLRLRIGADGRVLATEVAQGSGHRILDRAALRAVRGLPALPLERVWERPRAFDMLLPVTYRLRDG